MHILQIITDTFADPSMFGYMGVGSLLGGTAGTAITMILQKVLNRKKENVDITDVINQQVKQVMDNSEFQENLIAKLREWSCYRENCKIRINGVNEESETISQPHKRKAS